MLKFKEFLVHQEQIEEAKGGQGVMPAGTGFARGVKRFVKDWRRNWKEVRHGEKPASKSDSGKSKHSGGAYPHRPDTGYHKAKSSAYDVIRHNDEKEHQNAIRTRGEKKTNKTKKHETFLKTRMNDYADDDRKFKAKLNNGKTSRRDSDGIKTGKTDVTSAKEAPKGAAQVNTTWPTKNSNDPEWHKRRAKLSQAISASGPKK
jgi:hypothetical protein